MARGHDVAFYLADHEDLHCSWMRCDARVKPLEAGVDDDLDIVLFNDERQWHLLGAFTRARCRVYYALHYAALYGKGGSWESVRAPVDFSSRTAIGPPTRSAPRPATVPRFSWAASTVMCSAPTAVASGIPCSARAARVGRGRAPTRSSTPGGCSGVPVERYAEKDLDQPALGREYDAVSRFAVGSWFEGFGQPGLEALACGVPLVTTDNGGCREYAVHEETALMVPPGTPRPWRTPSGDCWAIATCRRSWFATGSTSWLATSTGSNAPTSSRRSWTA